MKQVSSYHILKSRPDDFTIVSNSESSFTDAKSSTNLAVLTGLRTKAN